MARGALIAFGGHLRAGKDAAADHLVGKGWVKVGMSDILHESLMAMNPIVGTQAIYDGNIPLGEQLIRYRQLVEEVGYTAAKEHTEVRRLLQRFGTEVGRAMFGEDFWVTQIERRLGALLEVGNDVTITGIRFPNEIEMIEALNGATVWVTRPGVDGPASHESEKSLTRHHFEYEIVNDGTLADLADAVEQVETQHFGSIT